MVGRLVSLGALQWYARLRLATRLSLARTLFITDYDSSETSSASRDICMRAGRLVNLPARVPLPRVLQGAGG